MCDSVITPVAFTVMPLGGAIEASFPTINRRSCIWCCPTPSACTTSPANYAGLAWKHSQAARPLTLKTAGAETLNGQPATHYEIGLSYMGLDMVAFIQARSEGFADGPHGDGQILARSQRP